MESSELLIVSIGIIVRLCLINSNFVPSISDRVEVSTPLNSWIRIKEGIFLHEHNLPVYDGGIYHGTPLELYASWILNKFFEYYIPLVFIAADVITALLLRSVAIEYSRRLIKQQEKEKHEYSKEYKHNLLKSSDFTNSGNLVLISYLFCPYIFLTCVSQTTTNISNIFLAASFYFMMKENSFQFGLWLGLSTYQNFYPISLLVPGLMFFYQEGKSVFLAIFSYLFSLICLLLISFKICDGWDFIESTYGFILTAPDLTPNIGLFWYFFTEMFEHFRLFFLATFQINAFVYVLPLAIKLRKDPVLLFVSLLALTTVFKSYPSLADVGLYLALMPIYKHLYSYLKQTFLVGCMLVSTSVLGPIMYNLWIFNGSANANFYFAVTLVFNTAQTFLITDILFAHVKRRYHLFNGSKLEIDGQPAVLVLEAK